jgi:hypothetical protein
MGRGCFRQPLAASGRAAPAKKNDLPQAAAILANSLLALASHQNAGYALIAMTMRHGLAESGHNRRPCITRLLRGGFSR